MTVLPHRAVAPLRQFVLKVHSRCNLACDHCYVYEHVDQGWLRQPRVMDTETLRVAAQRIAEHAAQHRLDRVTVVLHGGEPLLIGASGLRMVLGTLRSIIGPVTGLTLGMQTNGLLLTGPICETLVEFGVRVGVSLDGDQAANDLHRRSAGGASSHSGVLRGLELLRRPDFRSAYSGLLCTVDLRNDPIAVYEALLAQRPPRLDFLLPHATWDQPPVRSPGDPAGYGRWLGTIYRRWTADGRPVPIRLFDSLRSAAAGGPSGTEWVGLDPVDLAVIETDGSWEQVDSLKTSFDRAAYTGLDVFRHPVDDVAVHPGIVQRQRGLEGLCDTCRACPIVRQCGGGLYAHRYRTGTGFDNPTVYCADVKELSATMNSEPSKLSSAAPPTDPLGRVIEDVATGYAGESTMEYLAGNQLAIARALIVAIGRRPDLPAVGRAGWELLRQLDQVAPDSVSAVLAHPYVRAWAARLLSQPAPDEVVATHLNHLAAAAAVMAGVDAEIAVVVRDGRVFLPTLGAVVLGDAGDGTAMLATSVGGLTVRGDSVKVTVPPDRIRWSGEGPSADWRPTQRIEFDGISLRLEDQDPYRDCHHWPAAGPLPDAPARSWRDSLVDAVRLLCNEVPGQRPGVYRGLTTVMPLDPGPDGGGRSATARHAFGAVAVAPAGAPELAAMLVHELQHVKLGALLDLVDLFDPHYGGLMTVAWRKDPRPLEGALQGTYAHLSLADLWWRRAQSDGPGQPRAADEFRRYRDWTANALATMLATRAFTANGHRFVAGMAVTLAGLTS